MSFSSILLLGLLLLPALFSCKGSDQGESLHVNGVLLRTKPGTMPEQVPADFRYPGSEPTMSGSVEDESFFAPSEGVILFQSKDSVEKIEGYYQNVIQKYGWNIIQSRRDKGEALLMSESPFRKLVTVIIRSGDPTMIRIYYRRSGDD